MAQLEELTRGAAVKGVLTDGLVTTIDATWYGSAALAITYKDSTGKLGEEILYRDREPSLEITRLAREMPSGDRQGVLNL